LALLLLVIGLAAGWFFAQHRARAGAEERARELAALQFGEITARLLNEAQAKLVEQAGQRFEQVEKDAGGRLQLLLKPVEDTLKRYEDGLKAVEKERVDQYAGLREAVELLRTGQTQVRDETARLVN